MDKLRRLASVWFLRCCDACTNALCHATTRPKLGAHAVFHFSSIACLGQFAGPACTYATTIRHAHTYLVII